MRSLMIEIEHKYSQRDPRWAAVQLGNKPNGEAATIGTWGCLHTVHAMLISRWLRWVWTPPMIVNAMLEAGTITRKLAGLSNGHLQHTFPVSVGYEGYVMNGSNGLHRHVNLFLGRGVPVAARVDFHPDPTYQQHWVLLNGVDEHGDWLCVDPWDGEQKVVSDHFGWGGDRGVYEVLLYHPKKLAQIDNIKV